MENYKDDTVIRNRIRDMVREIHRDFFKKGDPGRLIELLSDNATCIGAGGEMFIQGGKAIADYFSRGKAHVLNGIISGESYNVYRMSDCLYRCEAICSVETADKEAADFSFTHRSTFIMESDGENWKISHIHGSVPSQALNGGRLYPFTRRDEQIVAIVDENSYAYKQQFFDTSINDCNKAGFVYSIEKMRRENVALTNYAVLFVSIMEFKAINTLYGAEAGEELLRDTYRLFSQSRLEPVVCARKDDGCFIFLVAKNKLDTEHLSGLLRHKWTYGGNESRIHYKCGVYFIEDNSEDVDKMIDRAEIARDSIPEDERVSCAVFSPNIGEKFLESAEILANFENAIKNKEFQVYYQPVVSAKTGRVISAEALIRWKKPDRGIISPDKFIPALEKYGYVTALDRYVLDEVADYLRNRVDEEKQIIPISVNLSRVDFYDKDEVDDFYKCLEKQILPKGSIRYEITETSYTTLEEKLESFIRDIRERGHQIYLDDFGSGYSSFGMIQNYDFDVLKIDMSFIRQIEKNGKVRKIIRTIISMCHDMGIEAVAEGVETKEELEFLRDNDCDYIQGYYFSRPLCYEDFEKYLEKNMCDE